MADFPSSIFSARTAGANLSSNPHSDLHDDSEAEIEAIETELGTAPSGTFSTVKARLDALTPSPGAWSPTLSAVTTPPTMGSGAVVSGSYSQNGRLVTGFGQHIFGTSGVAAGSGVYIVAPPVTPSTSGIGQGASTGTGGGSPIGDWIAFDASGAFEIGIVQLRSSTSFMFVRTATGAISNSAPWTWDTQDRLHYRFSYWSAS